MTREEERSNMAIEYANAVTDGNQDAWFDIILKTHQDATTWADRTMIDKICNWVKENLKYIHPRKGTEECIVNVNKLRDYLEGNL